VRLVHVIDELRDRLGEHRFRAAEQTGRTAAMSVLIDLIVSQLRFLTGAPPAGAG